MEKEPVIMDWSEKRRHPRFKAADNALAASREDPYTLMDLSAGGFGIRFYGHQPLPGEITMDLFFLDREFTLIGVRCRKVFEKIHPPVKPERMPEWYVGLEIIDPTKEITQKLREFRYVENDPGKKC